MVHEIPFRVALGDVTQNSQLQPLTTQNEVYNFELTASGRSWAHFFPSGRS